jgi:hypothetical protein
MMGEPSRHLVPVHGAVNARLLADLQTLFGWFAATNGLTLCAAASQSTPFCLFLCRAGVSRILRIVYARQSGSRQWSMHVCLASSPQGCHSSDYWLSHQGLRHWILCKSHRRPCVLCMLPGLHVPYVVLKLSRLIVRLWSQLEVLFSARRTVACSVVFCFYSCANFFCAVEPHTSVYLSAILAVIVLPLVIATVCCIWKRRK